MRHCLLPVATVGVFLSTFFAQSALTQQQQQQQQQQPPAGRGSVQVGVPEGRQGAQPARQGGQGRGGRQAGPPPGPAPRTADGRIVIGGKGVWLPGGLGGGGDLKTIPFQPWARAVLDDRLKNQLEPHTRCKPSGGTRQFVTPYGVEIVDLPELQRIYIFDIGGPHTYRTIYMDGRTHPKDLQPTYYGHSIGWWEGDTLVVDTVGFNEGFWLDRRGSPHTERLRTLERLTRTNAAVMRYDITIDDPGAYTASWKMGQDLRWDDGIELFEYVCQQQNFAHNLMLGEQKSVDRTTLTVP